LLSPGAAKHHQRQPAVERSLYERGIGYNYETVRTIEEDVIGDQGQKLTLVKRTTTTGHVPGDVGAQRLGSQTAGLGSGATRSMSQMDRPERSAAEIKADIVRKLIVKLAPLDPPLIEGAAKVTYGVARIGVKTRGGMRASSAC
jgi:hypothetical protein